MSLAERLRVHDLADPSALAQPPSTADRPVATQLAHQYATAHELAELVAGLKKANRQKRRTGTRDLLAHLQTLPAETWADRWALFEATSTSWRAVVLPNGGENRRQSLVGAVLGLMLLDVIRPSYRWATTSQLRYADIGTARDAEATALLQCELQALEITPPIVLAALRTASLIQAHTGKALRELAAKDLLAMRDDVNAGASHYALPSLWSALRRLGWLEHEAHALPLARSRGRKSCEELVARAGITGPCAPVLIEYLKHRTAGLDYPSVIALAGNLLRLYWKDLIEHHGELTSFAVTREQIDGWKDRIKVKPDGTPRRDHHTVMFTVRSFYLDMAHWALQDPYWVAWVAPSPIYTTDLKGYKKTRRAITAATQQRTRELAPVLPRLVDQADRDRRQSLAALQAAQAAGPGATIDLDGQPWQVFQSSPSAPLRARRNGTDRNLTEDEDNGFWAWAILETLRHTGIRHEELLELTHLSIQPYTVPSTGEALPLLHIAPSKIDQERLLVASPEVVHVLAQVVNRLRAGRQTVPLSQRWDGHEKVLSSLAPHLFVKVSGPTCRGLSASTVGNHFRRLAARAGITIGGQPMHFTPLDMRRIFATDALASGLPPHIVQVLMGHKNIATTQGYAAIYPADVIRHHRTFIAQRRQQRPSEEYREPTPQEWEEFEAHFVTRKVSLGSCSRAYGTSCHHEHACVRCSLLRPDPNQLERMHEITDNLRDRITEATDQGWLGEVEGLQISLTGAEHKLRQMTQMLEQADEPVVLGLPRLRPAGSAPRASSRVSS